MKPVNLPIHNIDRTNKIVWVRSHKRVFPCKIVQDYIALDMRRSDKATVVKSSISGEWLCIDYEIPPITETDYIIHNSYQEGLPEPDYIYNEEGDLYG